MALNHTSPASLASSAPAPSVWLLPAAQVLGGTAFLALCAHVALPLWFTPVPLTLQPFGVLLLGLLFSPRLAATTLAAYLGEGLAGLPVFAPVAAAGPAMFGGLAHLIGPTGGYLLAYPAAAALIATLRRALKPGFVPALLAACAGDALILACGALWLALTTHTSATAVFGMAVLPFLPGEGLKASAAAALAAGANKLLRRVR